MNRLFTEREAAEQLGIHQTMLARTRKDKLIDYVSVGRTGRSIRYTHEQLLAYIERSTVAACPANPNSATPKSVTSGSSKSPARTASTSPGTTPSGSSAALVALARTTFAPQSSSSPSTP
ncbi:DNA-binding protein [Azospirillum cavernae]|uniref:DNA-binding protein n=1 Tax=Azospirillum cavernae TaxID=2320860 RepID=A0A418W3Y2_9PROT|nr:DNA-binding protein [Azospirillum cavernae]